ncbi:MAG: vWA domain-containing protein [Myxococcota bacterium]|nr:vWA domain-containing protein [Myxococcota bacterium]
MDINVCLRTTGRLRVNHHVHGLWLALSVLLTVGCAPIHVRMESLIERGDYHDAAEAGHEWLRAGGDGQAEQTVRVELLIAKARMKAAISSKDVSKIAAFRRQHSVDKRFSKLIEHALDRESILYLETVARPRDSVIVYRRFRETYPDVKLLSHVQELEVKAALRDARALKTADAYKRIRMNYGTWPNTRSLTRAAIREEAQLVYETQVRKRDDLFTHREFLSVFGSLTDLPSIQMARKRELQLALERAKAEDMLLVYDQFTTTYDGWPEAKQVLEEVRRLRAARALKEATAVGTVAAFESFRRRHDDPKSLEAADKAEIKSMFQMFESAIVKNHRIALGIGRPFIKKYGRQRFLTETVEPIKNQLKQRLVDLPDRWSARLFRLAYPDDPGNLDLLKAEMALAWSEASQQRDAEKLLDYILWYPASPEAQKAEDLYFKSHQRPPLDTARVHVRAIATQGGGQRIHATVTGCNGQKNMGLPAHSFRLDGRQMDSASGMGTKTPIDVVFLVDLSGSLLTERTQLIESMPRIDAELRSNGHAPRYSIVGFAKSVVEQRSWFNDPKQVTDALGQLPLSSLQAQEDSAGALLATTGLSYRKGASRIAIMVTDEPLMMTSASVTAAKIPRPSGCKQAAQVETCLKACKRTENAATRTRFACVDRCIKRAKKAHKKMYLECIESTKKGPASRERSLLERQAAWLEKVDLAAIATAAECRQPLNKAPKVEASLKRFLKTAGLQTFFLKPGDLKKTPEWKPLGAVPWAHTFKYSRNNSASGLSESLNSVLVDILSTHSIRPKSTKSPWSPKSKLTVEHPLVWHKVFQLPRGRVLGLYRFDSLQTCRRDYALTQTEGIFFRDMCRGPWRSLENSAHVRPKVAFSDSNSIWMLTHDGRVHRIDSFTGRLEDTTPKGVRVGEVVVGQGTVFLHGAKINDALGVWTWKAERGIWAESNLPVELDGVQNVFFVPTNAVSQHAVCLHSTPQQVWCYQAHKKVWIPKRSTGLPKDFGPPKTPVVELKKIHQAGLLFAPDGTFFRTISGGRVWTRSRTALGPFKSIASSRLGLGDVCALNETAVLCSTNLGRTWKKQNTIEVPDFLIEYQGHVHGIMAGSLYRLERMLDRRAYGFGSSSTPTDGLLRPLQAKRHLMSSFLSNKTMSLNVSVHGTADQHSHLKSWLLGLSSEINLDEGRVNLEPVQSMSSGHPYVQFTLSTAGKRSDDSRDECQ